MNLISYFIGIILYFNLIRSSHTYHILGNLLVRELWVGNLNDTITEDDLRKHFITYGDIENIQLFTKT